MISYLLVLLLVAIGNSIECGPGIPILTRQLNEKGTYNVALQCLCPIDFRGIQCKEHRLLACYLETNEVTPDSVDSSSFQDSKAFNVTFSADCYIQLEQQKFISFLDYFIRKEIKNEEFQYELESGKDGGDILWANNSNLLTPQGFVKYQDGYEFTEDEKGNKRLSAEDQQAILYGRGPYQFKYKSQFLGFPFTDSNFTVVTNIYKILQNKRVLPTQKLNFINYNEYKKAIKDKLKKEEEAKEYIQNLSWRNFIGISGFKLDNFISEMTEIRKDVENFAKMDVLPLVSTTIVAHLKDETEFGMLKAELKIKQTYQGGDPIAVSINSAVVRIPIRVEGVGEAKVYNSNFYKPPSRIIYFIIGAIALLFLYIAYRLFSLRKAHKLKKIKKSVEDEFQVKQFR